MVLPPFFHGPISSHHCVIHVNGDTVCFILSSVADKRTIKILTRHEYMCECATWQFAATLFANYLQLLLVAQIKSRIIMENKTRLLLNMNGRLILCIPC